MEVYVVPGGDWSAVEGRGLVTPPAKRGLDLFVDPVADRLHNFGFDDGALGVDRDFDDDVSVQVPGELGSRHGRVGIHDRVGDVGFVTGDWSVNHGAEGRSRTGAVT